MKFKVPICWRTVEVEWTSVEVEADSVEAAKDLVEDMYLDSKVEFRGKSEVVEGSYEFGEIVEIPQEVK
jgi:hypothetical protein